MLDKRNFWPVSVALEPLICTKFHDIHLVVRIFSRCQYVTLHLGKRDFLVKQFCEHTRVIIAAIPGLNHLYQKTVEEAEKMLVISVGCHFSETGEWFQIDSVSPWRRDRELPLRPPLVSERRAANQTAPLWQPRRARPYLGPQTHLWENIRKYVSFSSVMVTAMTHYESVTWI